MDERGRSDQDDKGILDTVRRILGEDQTRASDHPVSHQSPEVRRIVDDADPDDDVLELEPAMMIENPPPASGRPVEPASGRPVELDDQLVGEQAEQTTRHALGSLRTVMREQRSLLTHRGGPSIEDVIREEMRPLLREWLDTNLPQLVEQLVRVEIARIVEREGL